MAENEAKKGLSKGAKIGIIVGVVFLVIAIVVGSVVGVLFGAEQPESPAVPVTDLDVLMYDASDATGATLKYYVGKDSEVDLAKAFVGATKFGGTCGVDASGKIAKGSAKDGTLTFKQDGKDVSYKVYAVAGVNAYGEDAENIMRNNLRGYYYNDKKEQVKTTPQNVVLHGDLTTKGTDNFLFREETTLYGNGNELHADSIAAPKDQKKNKRTSWGKHVFGLYDTSADKYDAKALHIQDLHLFVNTVPADAKEVKLEDFEYSGNGIDISADVQENGKYALSTVTNVVVENGQKLLHIAGADVKVEGCIFRNGADANIASGTRAKKGSNITIKNSVSMNSIVAGFLFYGYEGVEPGNEDAQQTLNVEGFFDIYNWKNTNAAKLVPATEAPLDTIVNGQVKKEINNPDFAPFVYLYDKNGDGKIQMPKAAAKNYPDRKDIEISESADERFIHIGIIRLATGSCKYQNPKVLYEGKAGAEKGAAGLQQGYSEILFPLPGWVKKPPLDIVKRCDMISYDSNVVPSILPDDILKDSIYKEMVFGRK